MTVDYNQKMYQDTSQWNVRDEHKGKSLDELQDICYDDQLPFAVCAVNITGDLNIGMMMRTASLLGAERFFIIGRRKYDRRSTVGAQNYLDVVRVNGLVDDVTIDPDTVLDTIMEYGYTPIAVETGGTAIERFNFHNVEKPCLILGTEGDGLPQKIVDSCDVVTLKQRGVLRSFNVSTTAGIAMYHVAGQLG